MAVGFSVGDDADNKFMDKKFDQIIECFTCGMTFDHSI